MIMLPFEEFNDIVIIHASGALTARTLPQLEHTMYTLINRCPSLIALDCAMISYIDAAVIAFLLRCNNLLKEKSITFAICSMNRDMKRKLEILNITKCLTILPPFKGDSAEWAPL